jgi:hypothetical protein
MQYNLKALFVLLVIVAVVAAYPGYFAGVLLPLFACVILAMLLHLLFYPLFRLLDAVVTRYQGRDVNSNDKSNS